MPSAVSSTIFRPTSGNQPVVVVLLIENSQEMTAMWPDLRDRHLPTLIGTLKLANPAGVHIFTVPSMSVSQHPPMAAQDIDQISALQFNFNANNRIGVENISHSIDLLDSTGRSLGGNSFGRHLIVFAASPATGPSDTRWQHVAQRMAKTNVHLHVVLNPNQNTTTLSRLFATTLRLQGYEEVHPWFQFDDQKYMFSLSARRSVSAPATPQSTIPSGGHPLPLPTETSPLWPSPPSDAQQQPPLPEPKVVAFLQHAHGLTKKKIYGAKPVRQPFFLEQRIAAVDVRAPSSGTGTSSTTTSPRERVQSASSSMNISSGTTTRNLVHAIRADQSKDLGLGHDPRASLLLSNSRSSTSRRERISTNRLSSSPEVATPTPSSSASPSASGDALSPVEPPMTMTSVGHVNSWLATSPTDVGSGYEAWPHQAIARESPPPPPPPLPPSYHSGYVNQSAGPSTSALPSQQLYSNPNPRPYGASELAGALTPISSDMHLQNQSLENHLDGGGHFEYTQPFPPSTISSLPRQPHNTFSSSYNQPPQFTSSYTTNTGNTTTPFSSSQDSCSHTESSDSYVLSSSNSMSHSYGSLPSTSMNSYHINPSTWTSYHPTQGYNHEYPSADFNTNGVDHSRMTLPRTSSFPSSSSLTGWAG